MPMMTPSEVAGDEAALQRFQNEVAYRAQRPRDRRVRDYDRWVLESPSGLLVIAWLWPDQKFAPDVDPFELASETSPDEWSARLGAQIQLAMAGAARAVAPHTGSAAADDFVGYLMWQAQLSEADMIRLGAGVVDQLAVWVRICRYLHLEFVDDNRWQISDPARLARRLDQAHRASTIADRLRHLPTGDLKRINRRLPPQAAAPADPVPPDPQEVYHAPKGRYRSLYQALARDERASPTYTIKEINRILTDHDEEPLPPSATKSPSWWAGGGTKTEGRPQVAAWWAAGYRIREGFSGLALGRDVQLRVEIARGDAGELAEDDWQLEHTAIRRVTFESLPGREAWLGDSARLERGEYRMPDRISVPLDTDDLRPRSSDYDREQPLLGQLRDPSDVLTWDPARESASHSKTARPAGPEDEDEELARLVQMLEAAGEMDREQIDRNLSTADDMSSDDRRSDGDGTGPNASRRTKSLLTRARRKGLIVNRGTNRKPRWVAVGSTGDLVLEIKQTLDSRTQIHEEPVQVPRINPEHVVPPDFLAQVASRLGLETPPGVADADLARAIIESAGQHWHDEYHSPSGPLTRHGLKAVNDAVLTLDDLRESSATENGEA